MPNPIVISVRKRVVRVIPIHKVAEALGLLGLDTGVLLDPLSAQIDKLGDGGFFVAWNQILNIFFALEPQLLLNLHFHPKTLGVETVLEALAESSHVFVALEKIFVGSPPSVVHSHRIVGGDWPVQKSELPGCLPIFLQIFFNQTGGVPPFQNFSFQRRKIRYRPHLFKRHIRKSLSDLPTEGGLDRPSKAT